MSSQSSSNQRNNSTNDGSKLWDNEELVITALKVYGKHPRPQCFNEISRVCKLSNLRKSRYFHEKMMKNNPFERQINKLIADEGEETYPFFKIFFDEFKTKKERLKLINNDEDKLNFIYKKESSNSFTDKQSSSSFLENIENSNEEDFYQNDYEVTLNETEDSINENHQPISQFVTNNIQFSDDDEMNPLINSNAQYLENLELKLKLLNKEKESMSDYFQTFSSVVDNLKIEIDTVKGNQEGGGLSKLYENDFILDRNELESSDLEKLSEKLSELDRYTLNLTDSYESFKRDQDILKEDLKVTKNFAYVENKRLNDELNDYKAQLAVKDEQIISLRNQLDNSMQHNRVAVLKNITIQSDAKMSLNKFNDLKENMDKLFDKITHLS